MKKTKYLIVPLLFLVLIILALPEENVGKFVASKVTEEVQSAKED